MVDLSKKSKYGEIIMQILSALYPKSHYEVTNTNKKKTTTGLPSGK
jgi:hypothetical protein